MLSNMLEIFEKEIADMREIIKSGDAEKLMEKLKKSKQIRDSFGKQVT